MRVVLIILCALLFSPAFSQKKNEDTVVKKKGMFPSLFRRLKDAVVVAQTDTTVKITKPKKIQNPFAKYEGKMIRRIYTEELGFEKTLTDTVKSTFSGTKLLNRLHAKTKSWVIYDNLFVRENTRLNAYLLTDNERFLRSLDFIQDARIVVVPVPENVDSIDLLVITKDLFSLTGSIDASGINRVKTKVAENNLAGMAQRVQLTTLYDKNRNPSFGYELLYTKNSIARSFINASIGYTRINSSRIGGTEDETAFYLKLDRPLVSPYSKMAGGFEMSINGSENLYNKPDSIFFNYKYNLYDVWAGINLGTGKILASKNKERKRQFLAIRYFNTHFTEAPVQIGNKFDPFYNSKQGFLGEFTFFKQEFNRTNYIYGFGTTEDVPYGYNVSLTAGVHKQLDLKRRYIGINANKYIFTDKQRFMQYFFRSGTFIDDGKWEDGAILLGVNRYSKLIAIRNFKLRNYFKFSYTKQFNRLTSEALRIDNALGLQYFSADSTYGSQRVSLYSEEYLISDFKLLGFRFAPFVFGDITMLTPENKSIFKSAIYTGIGGGIRTRNENLVFGTIELRLMYFPRVTEQQNSFSIRVQSNIRFRYNSSYVKAPDIIQLNNDAANNIY